MYVKVNRANPRISVTMDFGTEGQRGTIEMYVRRVGEPAEFAVYEPIEVTGSVALFQFDELLFTKQQGRYEGRLVVGADGYGCFHFIYDDAHGIVNITGA